MGRKLTLEGYDMASNNSGITHGNGGGFRPPSQRGNPQIPPGQKPGRQDRLWDSINKHSKGKGNSPIRNGILKPEPGYDKNSEGGPLGDVSDTN